MYLHQVAVAQSISKFRLLAQAILQMKPRSFKPQLVPVGSTMTHHKFQIRGQVPWVQVYSMYVGIYVQVPLPATLLVQVLRLCPPGYHTNGNIGQERTQMPGIPQTDVHNFMFTIVPTRKPRFSILITKQVFFYLMYLICLAHTPIYLVNAIMTIAGLWSLNNAYPGTSLALPNP